MSAQSEPVTDVSDVSGEYVVVNRGAGQGIDYYLDVVGPDGRATQQKVYWFYSMTPHQVVEQAVAGHLGQDVALRASTRQSLEGGEYVVTVE